jgi:PhnB protein
MKVQSYFFFDGRCEEALDFYAKVLGAKVTMLMRFKDNPDPQPSGGIGCAPRVGTDDKVMHAEFTIGDTTLMASDGNAGGNRRGAEAGRRSRRALEGCGRQGRRR